MPACAIPYSLFQGATKVITLTVLQADGDPQNLTGITGIEYQVKPAAGDADTELILSKSVGSGITILDQTVGSDTEGQAEITLVSSDTSPVTPGKYEYDIVVILADGSRHYVVPPSPWFLHAVVNQA